MQRPDQENRKIPTIVEQLLANFDERKAYQVEGVFRISGQQEQLKQLMISYDTTVPVDLSKVDVHIVASAIKYYLQALPVPLLTYALRERFVAAIQQPSKTIRLDYIHCLLGTLPPSHYELCRRLTQLMAKVADHQEENKMNLRNLGIIFGPLVWRAPEDDENFTRNFQEYSQHVLRIGRFLIRHYHELFESNGLAEPLWCFRATEPLESDWCLDIQVGQIVYVFKEEEPFCYAEWQGQCSNFPLSFLEARQHKEFRFSETSDMTVQSLGDL